MIALAGIFFGAQVRVDIFVTTDCPICRRYSPEIGRIIKSFSPASFRLVYPQSGVTENGILAHQKEFGLKAPFVSDAKGKIAKQSGVSVVPTAVVWRGSTMVYRGRIDDAYGPDYKWRKAKQFDLRNSLKRALEGRTLNFVETTPVGCSISF